MAIVQCSRKHYYDNEKFCDCPHCVLNNGTGSKEDESVTVPLSSREIENYAVEYVKNFSAGKDVQLSKKEQFDEERTVSIYEKTGIAGYTAGWLVCVEGENYGQDFPLYAGFNRIGRSKGSDIVLRDLLVSRDEHCSVIYEEKKMYSMCFRLPDV